MEINIRIVLVQIFLSVSVNAACFFPTELQGSYAVQYVEGNKSDIWYRSVSISYDFISGLGQCVFRQRERYVLETEAGCYKCVGLKQRSYNVLTLVDTDTCYTSPDVAWATCEDDSQGTRSMLYRAGNKIRPTQCPITGRYTVSCGGQEKEVQGEADTCPDESLLAITCPGQEPLSFTCLGDWTGEDGRQYLSLLDRVLPQVGEEARPRWRCAVIDQTLGDEVVVRMSNDSTCDNMYTRDIRLKRQHVATTHVPDTDISLPDWAQGTWDSVHVSGGYIVHRSRELLTTHHLHVIQSHHHGVYTVHVSTDCGETGYACLDIMGRGDHESGKILELRLSQIYSQRHEVRCGLRQDKQLVKVTQLRHKQECPMPGEWQGEIPDGEGLCARSVTSCDDPYMMKYQVYNCATPSEVYEDRLYECYGQYNHGGQVYTLTKRLDLQERQECFVGVTTDGGQHRVMEAGEHCDRGKQPQLYGMVMEPVRPLQCNGESEDRGYQENVSEIEMRLLHPKLTLQTDILDEDVESTNSVETSAINQEMFSSGSTSYSLTLSVISLASLLYLLAYL